jgi:hypothetical protein
MTLGRKNKGRGETQKPALDPTRICKTQKELHKIHLFLFQVNLRPLLVTGGETPPPLIPNPPVQCAEIAKD